MVIYTWSWFALWPFNILPYGNLIRSAPGAQGIWYAVQSALKWSGHLNGRNSARYFVNLLDANTDNSATTRLKTKTNIYPLYMCEGRNLIYVKTLSSLRHMKQLNKCIWIIWPCYKEFRLSLWYWSFNKIMIFYLIASSQAPELC